MMNSDPYAIQQWDTGHLQKVYIGNTVLAVIFIMLRISARYNQSVGIGADDYTILAALALLFVNLGLGLMMLHSGLGSPSLYLANVAAEELIRFQKIMFAFEPIYALTLAVIKISILVMYTRIFALSCFRTIAWVLSVNIAVYTIIFICLCMFRCSPIEGSWGSPPDNNKCMDLRAILIGFAIPNIVTDVFILITPMRKVWALKVDLMQRLELMGLFLLGFLVIFASSYRLATVININNDDLSGTTVSTLVWSHVEVSVAITSACLPTLRPHLRKLVQLYYHLRYNLSASWRQKKSQQCDTSENTGGTGMVQTNEFQQLPEVHKCHEGHVGFLVMEGVTKREDPYVNLRELPQAAKSWRDVP